MIISCEEMKTMDSYAINKIGIPSIVLMENAALKVVKNIDLYKTDSFTIICGIGNNGGDGLDGDTGDVLGSEYIIINIKCFFQGIIQVNYNNY